MTKQKKIVLYIWSAFILGIIGFTLVILLAIFGFFGKLPSIEKIKNPNNILASTVISEDREILGSYFKENRSPVTFNQLPNYLVEALVSTEDERFFTHSGIDFISLARAVFTLGSKGGGSTITQQVAKMHFTDNPSHTIDRIRQKVLEWIIAVQLEKQYTKEEIISMYFNKFDFLYQAVGVKSAAKVYFNKSLSELTLPESALLVGMAKNPSYYNPNRNTKLALDRRNTVLYQMYRLDKISEAMYLEAKAKPIDLHFKRQGHIFGIATYFREYIRLQTQRLINKVNKERGTDYDIYSDGLKIYTTINSKMQKYAEEAVQEHLSNLQRIFFEDHKNNPQAPYRNISRKLKDSLIYKALIKIGFTNSLDDSEKDFNSVIKLAKKTKRKMKIFSWNGEIDTLLSIYDSVVYYKHILQTGFLSLNPGNGHIKAWVGGINSKYFNYDHVSSSARQVGSLFKPFVYSTVIDRLKISPCETFPNLPVTFKKDEWGLDQDWTPKNADDKYGGEVSIKEGLAKSINTITASLMKKIGPNPVITTARKMGITSYLPPSPSLCLGTADVTLREMVSAFGTFANRGVHLKPITILKIEDKNRVPIFQYRQKSTEVMNEESAYITLKMMEEVARSGTAIRLRIKGSYWNNPVTGFPYELKMPIAAKTGTTQNHSDGWFIGTVPNLVSGAWVGCEDRAANFKSIYYGQGATMALPIWALYTKKIYADKSLNMSYSQFRKPKEMTINIDCNNRKSKTSSEDNKSIDSFNF